MGRLSTMSEMPHLLPGRIRPAATSSSSRGRRTRLASACLHRCRNGSTSSRSQSDQRRPHPPPGVVAFFRCRARRGLFIVCGLFFCSRTLTCGGIPFFGVPPFLFGFVANGIGVKLLPNIPICRMNRANWACTTTDVSPVCKYPRRRHSALNKQACGGDIFRTDKRA